jgi:hypothetical protein
MSFQVVEQDDVATPQAGCQPVTYPRPEGLLVRRAPLRAQGDPDVNSSAVGIRGASNLNNSPLSFARGCR